MNIAGGYQDSQFEGGVGRVTDAVAAELGDAVVLSSPVTAVTQHAERVEVVSERATVSARRAVLRSPGPWLRPSAPTPRSRRTTRRCGPHALVPR